MMTKDYSLFIKWRGITCYLLERCGKYPKSVRFNLCGSITDLSLDAMELIVKAIYTKQRNALRNTPRKTLASLHG